MKRFGPRGKRGPCPKSHWHKEERKKKKCIGCEGVDGTIKNIPDEECSLCEHNKGEVNGK